MERDRKERGFELDAWARFDLPSEDYYDLEEYPEGYTGYDGSSVWKFLYENLTFGKEAIEEENDPNGWHNVFDRAVSGLHASIACHVVDDYSGPRASVESESPPSTLASRRWRLGESRPWVVYFSILG